MIFEGLFRGATSSPIRSCGGASGYLKWTELRWISGEQWPVVSHLPTSSVLWKVGWPLLLPYDAGSRGQKHEGISIRDDRTSCQGQEWDSPTQSGLKEGGDGRSLKDSCPQLAIRKAIGVIERDKFPSCWQGKPRAIWPGCVCVGSGGSTVWGSDGIQCWKALSYPLQWLFC